MFNYNGRGSIYYGIKKKVKKKIREFKVFKKIQLELEKPKCYI